jgi:hypothetical protein
VKEIDIVKVVLWESKWMGGMWEGKGQSGNENTTNETRTRKET